MMEWLQLAWNTVCAWFKRPDNPQPPARDVNVVKCPNTLATPLGKRFFQTQRWSRVPMPVVKLVLAYRKPRPHINPYFSCGLDSEALYTYMSSSSNSLYYTIAPPFYNPMSTLLNATSHTNTWYTSRRTLTTLDHGFYTITHSDSPGYGGSPDPLGYGESPDPLDSYYLNPSSTVTRPSRYYNYDAFNEPEWYRH